MIFLIGYMGCGKSTIGRKLSTRLGWRLVDTDQMIEEREKMTISEIFEKHGEPYFRDLERDTLRELQDCGESCVVSTGGGLPVWGDNMSFMREIGVTIYLRRTAENIASRLSPRGREKRPKLRGLSYGDMVAFMSRNIEERDPIYSESELIIEAVPMSDNEILTEVIDYAIGR